MTTPIGPRLRRLAATGLIAAAATLGVAAPALAHDELTGYDVVVDTSTGEVEGFSLTFSSEILGVGTEIIATDASGTDVRSGDPVVDGRAVTQSLAAPLDEGAVDIAWRVVSSDGHPISGALSLAVHADGSGTLEIVSPEDLRTTSEADDRDSGQAPQGSEQPWWIWALVAVGTAGAAAAIGTTLIIGARRRRHTVGGDGQHPGSTSATDSH